MSGPTESDQHSSHSSESGSSNVEEDSFSWGIDCKLWDNQLDRRCDSFLLWLLDSGTRPGKGPDPEPSLPSRPSFRSPPPSSLSFHSSTLDGKDFLQYILLLEAHLFVGVSRRHSFILN